MMFATEFPEQFSVKAAKVNSSAPSTTNWVGVRILTAEELGLEPTDVYVTTISKPGNVSVRFSQSKTARKASVLLAMHTDVPEALGGTIAAMEDLVVERSALALIAMSTGGTWSIVAVVAKRGDERSGALVSAFPEAVVVTL